MKISILGAGNVGGNLGIRWAELKHEIFLGVRDTDSPKIHETVKKIGAAAHIGEIEEAAEFGDILILSLPWPAVERVAERLKHVKGKIIIDATNPVSWDNGPHHALGTSSSAQRIAATIPNASIVKAFNTFGAEHILTSNVGGIQMDHFIACSNENATEITKNLSNDIGFNTIHIGPLHNALLIEQLAIFWIHQATIGGMGRNIAWKLLRNKIYE